MAKTEKTVEKEVVKDDNVLLPENDQAVEAAKAVETTNADALEYADDKDSKDKVKKHEEFTKDLAEGKVKTAPLSPSDLAEVQKPLVPEIGSGRPVYETQSQYLAAEAAKGNLHTDSK